MAIAYVTEDTETDVTAGSTITSSSVTIADNEYVIVCVGSANSNLSNTNDITGVTINGNAMTKLAESVAADGAQASYHASIWGFQATTGFTGVAVATAAGNCNEMGMSVLSITGHDTGTTIGDVDDVAGNSSGGTPVSLTMTTAAGDLVIDCLAIGGYYGNDPVKDAGQTLVLDTGTIGTAAVFGASTEVAAGGSTTVSWTNPGGWLFRYCAVVVKMAAGGGGGSPPETPVAGARQRIARGLGRGLGRGLRRLSSGLIVPDRKLLLPGFTFPAGQPA